MQVQGVIGIALANSPEFVAAAPGGKACFGTNPIAFGIPSSSGPLCFDMATSAIALFGVLTSKAKGEPLPPNVAYGKDGGWTTDAAEALEGGAIATFGGHKGAGLSLCVELLAGAIEHGRGHVDPDDVLAGPGHRGGDAPRPDPDLEDRSPGGDRLGDVEGDDGEEVDGGVEGEDESHL